MNVLILEEYTYVYKNVYMFVCKSDNVYLEIFFLYLRNNFLKNKDTLFRKR